MLNKANWLPTLKTNQPTCTVSHDPVGCYPSHPRMIASVHRTASSGVFYFSRPSLWAAVLSYRAESNGERPRPLSF